MSSRAVFPLLPVVLAFSLSAGLVQPLPLSPQLQQSSSPAADRPQRPSPLWLAIERILPGSEGLGGDLVLIGPEHCVPEEQQQQQEHRQQCAELLGAAGAEPVPRARCVCRCPPGEPIFLQRKWGGGKCVPNLPDVPGRQIPFEHAHLAQPQFAPTVGLPRRQGEPLVAQELRIAWRESGVKVRQGQGPRCSLQSAQSLANDSQWHALDVSQDRLFTLGWAQGDGKLLWTGQDKDADQLAGSIVRILLNCVTGKSGNGTFVVVFRVEGQIETALVGTGPSGGSAVGAPAGGGAVGVESGRARRAEVLLIILLAILLFLSLFGSFFLWKFCWRVHKRKLVHSLQMQFLHYARQEKEKAISECQLRYQALVKAAAGVRSSTDAVGGPPCIGALNQGLLMAAGGGQLPAECFPAMANGGGTGGRRKLFFSAEFFEPQLMSNPPPMAEQFLYDLRKMIGVARERIRCRRHVPRLAPVVESEDESTGREAGGPAESTAKRKAGAEEGGKESGGKGPKVMVVAAKETAKPVEQPMEMTAEAKGGGRGEKEQKEAEEMAVSMEQIVQEQRQRRAQQQTRALEERKEQQGEKTHEERGNHALFLLGHYSVTAQAASCARSDRAEEAEVPGAKEPQKRAEEEETNCELELSKAEQQSGTDAVVGEQPKQRGDDGGDDAGCPAPRQPQLAPMGTPALNGTGSSTASSNSPPPSKIPTAASIGNSSKSPRLQLKFTAVAAVSRRVPPPLPPRPPPPPPPASGAAEARNEGGGGLGRPNGNGAGILAAAKRKVFSQQSSESATNREEQRPSSAKAAALLPSPCSPYAVDPPSYASDHMKKSLPRRKRASMIPSAATAAAAAIGKNTIPTVPPPGQAATTV